MKFLANFSRILVGIEFIFSGFVKVVDPYGTGLKLQEYFEVFQGDLPALSAVFGFFAEHAVALSLIFCVVEFTLGFALLFNYKMKVTAWLVLGLMTFFTFLTFYSAYFNKVTDCGCFGDFLKLKPWHSFYKDIISMVFILIIFFYRNQFKSFKLGGFLSTIGLIIGTAIGSYALYYLPPIDFLPYAKGKSIPKQMELPKIKPEIAYTFLDKNLKQEIQSQEYLTDTVRFKYVKSETLNEDLLKPKITDYSLTDTSGNDMTSYSFEKNKLLFIIKKKEGLEKVKFSELKTMFTDLKNKNIEPLVLSSLPMEDLKSILDEHNLNVNYYNTDEKVLKTMARNNPCFILLKEGTVVNKWPYTQAPVATEITELINNK